MAIPHELDSLFRVFERSFVPALKHLEGGKSGVGLGEPAPFACSTVVFQSLPRVIACDSVLVDRAINTR